MKSFEARSRGLLTPCVRFAAEVALGPRNTRFPAGRYTFAERVFPAGSVRKFQLTHPPSPGFAWRTASLFYFLHRELGLSSGAAFYRKTAAELIQRFPEIVDPLRDGRLCMTSVVELAKILTPENRDEVLPRFFHLSKSGAKAVSAALRPAEAAPHRAVVTAVRPAAAALALALSGRELRRSG